jgi:thiol:disulfide interchange protein DsbC
MCNVRQLILSFSSVILLLTSITSWAQEGDALKEKLASVGVNVTSIASADIDGLVEVHTHQGVLFATPDGKYFIAGTLYHMNEKGQISDVLAERQAPINAKEIAKHRSEMIEYKAPNEKYAVTIFTDITCGYCSKLHQQMNDYNALGITIRYLAFPREGLKGKVAQQMAAIWCSSDPKQALDKATLSHQVEVTDGQQCSDEIASHYALGQKLHVSGTPAVFLPGGRMVGGYLPPEALLERLENL